MRMDIAIVHIHLLYAINEVAHEKIFRIIYNST